MSSTYITCNQPALREIYNRNYFDDILLMLDMDKPVIKCIGATTFPLPRKTGKSIII